MYMYISYDGETLIWYRVVSMKCFLIEIFVIYSLNVYSSPTWKNIPAARRKELLEGDDTAREDGEFYMSFQDFKKHFTDFEVCNISVDQLYEDENGES